MIEQIVTRREAKERGLREYFPGSCCKHGHVARRLTRNGECVECEAARLANRDRTTEYAKRKNPAFLENQRSYMGRWREEHRDDVREYHRSYGREWTKLNHHKKTDNTSRFRVKRWGAFVEEVSRLEVFKRDGWCCQICHTVLNESVRFPDPRSATVDHIIPLCKGGKHEWANVQTACYQCNVRKSSRDPREEAQRAG